MKLRVTYLDNTPARDLVAGAAAKTALERKTGMIWFEAFNDKAKRREEFLFFLAWRSLPVDERPDDFDEWLENVLDVLVTDDEDETTEPDPTQPSPGPEDSSH